MATKPTGEKTQVNVSRELLYKEHQETVSRITKLFEQPILPSEMGRISARINSATRNLNLNVRATMMSSIEYNTANILLNRNAELKSKGYPTMTVSQMERLQNNIMKTTLGTFKGANVDRRLDVSKRMANLRLKQEALKSTSKEEADKAKARAIAFLTDKRESGVSIVGGSNFKYNERILVSEYNRAEQEATKEFLKETGMLGRWTLSENHKRYDICDVLAEESGEIADQIVSDLNLHVLMNGVYDYKEMPEYPHPFCQCNIDPVYRDYGIINKKNKFIWNNAGENMVPYNQGLVGKESQEYYQEWLKREYKTVKPYDFTRRSPLEIEKAMSKIEDRTTAGLNGAVAIRNKPLEKYVQTGGNRGYAELSKNLLGKSLDQETVDKIGLDNAIKLMAKDLKSDPNIKEIIASLDKYNQERLPLVMHKSLAESRKAMAEADSYRLQVLDGTPKRAVQGLRTKALVRARTELGDAVGYADVHERLLTELKSVKSMKFMNIGVQGEKQANDIRDYLGLSKYESKTTSKGISKFLSVDEKGLKKLSLKYEQATKLKLTDELDKIREGLKNKKGWLPANFNKTYVDKLTGETKPMVLTKDQQTGIRFAKENKSALLHYKPGAGKTNTAIGTITDLASEGKIKKALVVVPNDLVRQFGDEVKSFTNNVSVKTVTWQNAEGRLKAYGGDQLITIISQSQLQADGLELAKQGYDIVVADEVHLLKPEMFQALKGINSEYRIGMTGTAIKNSISDMHDTLDWLSPTGIPSRARFDSAFKDITKASSIYQETVLKDLQDTIKPLVITRDSPVEAKLLIRNRNIDLSDVQRVKVRDIETKALARFDAGQPKREVEAWRDRQLGKVVNAGDAKDNAKLEEVNKILNFHKEEKVLVFASDKDAMATLKSGLGERASYYTSDLSKAQKDVLIKEFRSNSAMKVLVLSDAGATGLNLEVSNVTIHWDIPDKAYKLEQRMARNWRGTKTDTTFQYLLKSNTTYDSRITKSLEDSKLISESAKIAETLGEQGVMRIVQSMLRRK